jgi:hypothetical protein
MENKMSNRKYKVSELNDAYDKGYYAKGLMSNPYRDERLAAQWTAGRFIAQDEIDTWGKLLPPGKPMNPYIASTMK